MPQNIQQLQQQMGSLIINTCNQVGCNNCKKKWVTGCAATQLQEKILIIEKRGAQLIVLPDLGATGST